MSTTTNIRKKAILRHQEANLLINKISTPKKVWIFTLSDTSYEVLEGEEATAFQSKGEAKSYFKKSLAEFFRKKEEQEKLKHAARILKGFEAVKA